MTDNKTKIQDCIRMRKRLDQWEKSFINEVARLDVLSDKRAAHLNEIWEEVNRKRKKY